MTILELIKKYGKGKGESSMWDSITMLSEEIEDMATDKDKSRILKKMYSIMQGGHYDEYFANEQMKKMFYLDKEKKEHYAPYWNEDKLRSIYDRWRNKIPSPYNFWDFAVTLNMIWSDNITMLKEWFEGATDEELEEKAAEMSTNWLDDKDNPFGDYKVWGYFNSDIL